MFGIWPAVIGLIFVLCLLLVAAWLNWKTP